MDAGGRGLTRRVAKPQVRPGSVHGPAVGARRAGCVGRAPAFTLGISCSLGLFPSSNSLPWWTTATGSPSSSSYRARSGVIVTCSLRPGSACGPQLREASGRPRAEHQPADSRAHSAEPRHQHQPRRCRSAHWPRSAGTRPAPACRVWNSPKRTACWISASPSTPTSAPSQNSSIYARCSASRPSQPVRWAPASAPTTWSISAGRDRWLDQPSRLPSAARWPVSCVRVPPVPGRRRRSSPR
jgi:hypothetical protein